MKINYTLKKYYKNILIEEISRDAMVPPEPVYGPEPYNPFVPLQTTPTQLPGYLPGETDVPPPTGDPEEDFPNSTFQEIVDPNGNKYYIITHPDGTIEIYRWNPETGFYELVKNKNGQVIQTAEELEQYLRRINAPGNSGVVPAWNNPNLRVVVNPGPPPYITVWTYNPDTRKWMPSGRIYPPQGTPYLPPNEHPEFWRMVDPETGYPLVDPFFGGDPPFNVPNQQNPTVITPAENQPGYVVPYVWDPNTGQWVQQPMIPGHQLSQPPYNIDPGNNPFPEMYPNGFPPPSNMPNLVPPGPGWQIVPMQNPNNPNAPQIPAWMSPDGQWHYWGPNGLTPIPDGWSPQIPSGVTPLPIPYPGGLPNPYYINPNGSPGTNPAFPQYIPGQPWPPSWYTPTPADGGTPWTPPPPPKPTATPDTPGGAPTPNAPRGPRRSPIFTPGLGPLSQGYGGPNPYYM